MSWYRLQATRELDEHLLEDCWRLCRDLCCSSESTDPGCAIFERLSGDTRTIFFSPAVGLMADKLGAQRCEKPSPDGLFLVYGELAAWRAHFSAMDEAQTSMFESTYRLAL
jgi:hypothetical protein